MLTWAACIAVDEYTHGYSDVLHHQEYLQQGRNRQITFLGTTPEIVAIFLLPIREPAKLSSLHVNVDFVIGNREGARNAVTREYFCLSSGWYVTSY